MWNHLPAALRGVPAQAARDFTDTAVRTARLVKQPQHIDNATVLVADLVP